MNTELIYLLVVVLSLALSASWVVGVTFYAQHVIKNQWFKNGGEVFK